MNVVQSIIPFKVFVCVIKETTVSIGKNKDLIIAYKDVLLDK